MMLRELRSSFARLTLAGPSRALPFLFFSSTTSLSFCCPSSLSFLSTLNDSRQRLASCGGAENSTHSTTRSQASGNLYYLIIAARCWAIIDRVVALISPGPPVVALCPTYVLPLAVERTASYHKLYLHKLAPIISDSD